MKGLLYKDIITNRANIFAMLFLLYAIIGCMALALWNDTAVLGTGAVTVPVGCIFVLNICIPFITMITGVTDNKTKWTQYALALPGGVKRIVLEKYVMCMIGQGIGILLSVILVLVVKLKLDLSWKALSVFAIPAVLGVGVFCIIVAIMLPIILKKSSVAVKIGIAALVMLVFGLEIYLCFGNLAIFEDKDFLIRAVMWIVENLGKVWLAVGGFALFGILCEIVSYKLIMRSYLQD